MTIAGRSHVLDVRSASLANDAAIIGWPSTGGANQRFASVPLDDGSTRIVNQASGRDVSTATAVSTSPRATPRATSWSNARSTALTIRCSPSPDAADETAVPAVQHWGTPCAGAAAEDRGPGGGRDGCGDMPFAPSSPSTAPASGLRCRGATRFTRQRRGVGLGPDPASAGTCPSTPAPPSPSTSSS
ncbi:RICIN domain-containing protein [Streptomyces achromogenes]|uniref:RICIN domain-containing protein n=1 Tax=Streptomyces achromogenes TaxID=67255 RepID=UPI0027D7EC61|nr:RICIN domain-containing protein [Streptomyces achromogenes]